MAHQAGTSTALPKRDDWGYHVFLNFRGPDSRYTVADALYHGLTDAGLRVFRDNEEIRKGEVIGEELMSAITNSRVYITIFSKDYASSKWCLHELKEMVECWRNSSGSETQKVIFPIFYDVDVGKDLKLESDVYKTSLEEHKKELGNAEVEPWEAALKEVAKICGWNLRDHGIVKLVEDIKVEVLQKLKLKETIVPDSSTLVGSRDQIEAIVKLLELDNNSPDPKFIVIHGVGGIGKTAIAKYIFKKYSSRFQGSCILLDIRRSSSDDDVVKLQKKILTNTLHLKSVEVLDTKDGIEKLSSWLRDQRLLIVLDDVDNRQQLVKLAGKSSWFSLKSRIIITTRNIDFLPENYSFYEMKELKPHHALQLFCRHAFEDGILPAKYYDIAPEIVATTGGLPLALELIGASLYNQVDGTWDKRLEDLKNAPYKDVRRSLMISYQALEEEQRQIFLDIACFFNNKKKVDPVYFWRARESYTDSRIDSVIDILMRRSMIKVIDKDKLWMHDQLRDLGREIAQLEIQYPGCTIPIKPSRLWSPKVALNVIQKREGVESIVAAQLGILDASCSFVFEEFAGLVNLSFLQLEGGKFEGDFRGVFQKLKWLSWFNCPLEFQGTNLSFNSLVVLKLSGKYITDGWGGWHPIKAAENLKILKLTSCPSLTRAPKFSKFLTLERLIFKYCEGLEEIHWSIDKLQSLKFLEISNLEMPPPQPRLLPKSIGGLTSLTVLKIDNAGLTKLPSSVGDLGVLKHLYLICPLLENLPSTIGNLRSLLQLDIAWSNIKNLPDSIGNLINLNTLRANDSMLSYLPESIGKLTSLNVLHLSGTRIIELPMTIEGLESLNELDLSGTGIIELPTTIGGLESLNELNLSATKIVELPATIGKLKRLKVLRLSFTPIKKLPKDIGDVCSLEMLYVQHCSNMNDNIPEEIGKLSSLRHLDLCMTPIRRLPTCINRLCHLQELHIGEFYGNFDEQLPELPVSLSSLKIYRSPLYSGIIPNLSNLTNLVTLEVVDGMNKFLEMTSKVEWLVRLTKLEELKLVLLNLALPLIDLSSLSQLRKLEITCFELQHLTRFPPSLEHVILHEVKSAIEIKCPQFSGLKNLSSFELWDCQSSKIHVNAPGELENLRNLLVSRANLVEELSGLSCLKNLKELKLCFCKNQFAIQGLEKVETLQKLDMICCHSIRTLPDLSSLQKLEHLCFSSCKSLTSLPHVANKEKCHLDVVNCAGLGVVQPGDSFRGPYHLFTRRGRTFDGRASENSGSGKRRRPRQMNKVSQLSENSRSRTCIRCALALVIIVLQLLNAWHKIIRREHPH